MFKSPRTNLKIFISCETLATTDEINKPLSNSLWLLSIQKVKFSRSNCIWLESCQKNIPMCWLTQEKLTQKKHRTQSKNKHWTRSILHLYPPANVIIIRNEPDANLSCCKANDRIAYTLPTQHPIVLQSCVSNLAPRYESTRASTQILFYFMMLMKNNKHLRENVTLREYAVTTL